MVLLWVLYRKENKGLDVRVEKREMPKYNREMTGTTAPVIAFN